ncbi:MAG: hypothetical protein GZ093_05275 [Rhodoferax sp.]|uniref:hypothetical protein n=1 Tax=Rhodoferax sp. TaxID=50421 RepID=UPI0013FFB19F|nr:hypothetical protein [Rhodoferax sp.]NDP38148.1 hypothetical protein [Rhodoferax sp.]
MPNHIVIATISIATLALSTGAGAQNVYKCGNTYSHMACPDGEVIDATDQRSSAQKYQTDQAVGRDARLADAMQKARLKQEKKDLAANTPSKKPLDKPVSARTPNKVSTLPAKLRNKEKEPEYFVAQRPGDKKKKSTSSTSTSAKDVNKR